MSKRKTRKYVRREAAGWAAQGIITEEQREQILALYEKKRGSAAKSRLPVIVIAMATVLLAVGLVLFYAANWKRMPPAVKLGQVFLLLVGTYTLGYYFYVRKEGLRLLGRAFQVLGMVCFGGSLLLTSQIYHVSAEPSLLLLVWLVGVVITTVATGAKVGIYLAMALAYVWDLWLLRRGEPNFFYLVIVAALAVVCWRWDMKTALLVLLLLLLHWFYKVGIHLLVSIRDSSERDLAILGFALLQLPLGLALLLLVRVAERYGKLQLAARVGAVLSWVVLSVPLIGVSWPLSFDRDVSLMAAFGSSGALWIGALYVAFTVAAAGLVFFVRQSAEERIFFAAGLLLAAVLFVLPMSNKTVLMVTTHLAIMAFIFGALYITHAAATPRPGDRITVLVIVMTIVLAKAVGFFALGMVQNAFFVAYGLGFVIFAVACHFTNLIVERLLAKVGRGGFPAALLMSYLISLTFLMFYALSFRKPEQTSVLSASVTILVLIFLFIAITVVLGVVLWLISTDKLLAVLSGGVFFVSAVTLVFAGPSISWIFYSVLFNLILLVMIAALLFYSSRLNSPGLANLGLALFVALVVTRYFDILWDLLAGSALFLVTGALAMGGGYLLLKSRRQLVRRIKSRRNEREVQR